MIRLRPLQFETFTSVVEFFRYFAPKDEAAIYDSDTTDEDRRSRAPRVPIEANVLCKITSANLVHALVEHEYLTEENARLFLNRLKNHQLWVFRVTIFSWHGDIHFGRRCSPWRATSTSSSSAARRTPIPTISGLPSPLRSSTPSRFRLDAPSLIRTTQSSSTAIRKSQRLSRDLL